MESRGGNSQQFPSDEFDDFFMSYEPGVRHALVASFGFEVGRDAAAEALAYAWEHWDRVRSLSNPAGYVYKVGFNIGRRTSRTPDLSASANEPFVVHRETVEPGLVAALQRLSPRQRQVVLLVHAAEYSVREAGDLLGLHPGTVQVHLRRGLRSLRRSLGVVPLDES